MRECVYLRVCVRGLVCTSVCVCVVLCVYLYVCECVRVCVPSSVFVRAWDCVLCMCYVLFVCCGICCEGSGVMSLSCLLTHVLSQ